MSARTGRCSVINRPGRDSCRIERIHLGARGCRKADVCSLANAYIAQNPKQRLVLHSEARLLAEELQVAPRTIYRDIADLQASQVPIAGEAGVGYVLRAGYDLPPMMFNAEELDAVVLYFFSHVTLLCAWCELRGDFRAFRVDRVSACELSADSFDPENGALLQALLRSRSEMTGGGMPSTER